MQNYLDQTPKEIQPLPRNPQEGQLWNRDHRAREISRSDRRLLTAVPDTNQQLEGENRPLDNEIQNRFLPEGPAIRQELNPTGPIILLPPVVDPVRQCSLVPLAHPHPIKRPDETPLEIPQSGPRTPHAHQKQRTLLPLLSRIIPPHPTQAMTQDLPQNPTQIRRNPERHHHKGLVPQTGKLLPVPVCISMNLHPK